MNPSMPSVLDLFGDESPRNSVVTYGLVVSPCKKTSAVETALGEVKEKFGANQEARLHCREIFWGDRRKSTVWAHLEPKDVFALCWEVARAVSTAGVSFRVGYVDRRSLPPDMLFAGRHIKTPAGPKQLVSFAYGPALAGFERDPGVSGIRLWIDPDPTRTYWGGRHRQATNIPLALEGNIIRPQAIEGDKPLLLDVADILAYCSAHSLSVEARTDKGSFQKIFACFNAEIREFSFHDQAFKSA